jgi:hypothetical protein
MFVVLKHLKSLFKPSNEWRHYNGYLMRRYEDKWIYRETTPEESEEWLMIMAW